MIPIITAGHPILAQKTKEVKIFDKKLFELIEQMRETLKLTEDPIGVGLSANQVGIPLRIFLARTNEDKPIKVFINPEIIEDSFLSPQLTPTKKTKSKKRLLEGCLSIPDIWGNVKRENQLTLSYQDENGKKYCKTFKGFMATIIQHEMDHLNGILFTKRVLEQKEKLYRSHKNKEGEDEFEEIKI